MREEEKLARDVYLAMDDLWGLRVFSQISWSEQNHMNAVLAILLRCVSMRQAYESIDWKTLVSPREPGVSSFQETLDVAVRQKLEYLVIPYIGKPQFPRRRWPRLSL